MSNFVDNANATALMGAVEESIANTRIFPGTLDEYDALTPEEKAKYKYIATPDQEVVPKNNLEAEIADIVNVYGAKNMIVYPYHDANGKVNRGITFTYDENGVVIGNGTGDSNNQPYFILENEKIQLKAGVKYTMSAEYENDNGKGFVVAYFPNSVETSAVYEDGTVRNITGGFVSLLYSGIIHTSVTFSCTTDTLVSLHARFDKASGILTNAKIKPLFRMGSIEDSTFVPYAKTNKQLTDNLEVKTIEFTNQASTNDGKLILTGMGHKMAIVSSRLLDDSNNHLIVPFGFCYSSNGDALFALVDNSTNAIITASITLSGTMEYIDLS